MCWKQMVLVQHMYIILISINCSEFFSRVFSGQESQSDCKGKEIIFSFIGKIFFYNSVKLSIDEICVLNKMCYADWGAWHIMICVLHDEKVYYWLLFSEWGHAKAISLHAERFIPKILLFEDKVEWCLSLLPQVALQSTNPKAHSLIFW